MLPVRAMSSVCVTAESARRFGQRVSPRLFSPRAPAVAFIANGFAPTAHSFHDVLVVCLGIKADVDGIIIHELQHSFGVIVEDEELSSLEVHENHKPIVGKYLLLEVIDINSHDFLTTSLSSTSIS